MPMALDHSVPAWSHLLEEREKRRGMKLPDARRSVANKIGVSPGTLENLSRGRFKSLRLNIVEAIRNAVIRELESEIAALSHELDLARQSGAHPASPEIIEAATAVQTARELLKGAK